MYTHKRNQMSRDLQFENVAEMLLLNGALYVQNKYQNRRTLLPVRVFEGNILYELRRYKHPVIQQHTASSKRFEHLAKVLPVTGAPSTEYIKNCLTTFVNAIR